MKYFSANHATINFIEDKKTVEIIWTDKSPDSGNYRLTLTKALVVIKQFGAETLLSDMSMLKKISPDDRLWVEEYLIKNASKSGLKKAVFILNDEINRLIHTDKFIKLTELYDIKIHSFDNVTDGYAFCNADEH